MKALFIFTALVLGYSMTNMFHHNAGAASYKDGINAYMEHTQTTKTTRSPAIVLTKKVK